MTDVYMTIGGINWHTLLSTSLLNRWSSRVVSVFAVIFLIAGMMSLRQILSSRNAMRMIPAIIAALLIKVRLPSASIFLSVSIDSNSSVQI